IWVVALAGSTMMFAALYPSLVPGQAEMLQLVTTMSSPAMVAMMGNTYGLDSLTQASVFSQECLIWYMICIAIMNIFLVNRHTRTDEELGRLEMFRALPVGRLTGTFATIVFAFIANLLVAVLTAVLLLILNIGGTDVAGAFAYGFVLGGVGFVFAGLTLLLAQVFSTSRGVTGVSFAFFLLFYIMRASGDVSGNALSLISPLGFGLKVEAFYSNDIVPIVVMVIEGLVLTVAALAVCAVRDHGAGIVPARKGRSHASRFLRGPLGLAWRTTRGTAIAWAVGMLVLGAAYGSVCADINSYVEGNAMIQQILGTGGSQVILDNYLALIYSIMSMVTSAPVVLTVLHVHGEERRGRLEQILAKSVSRTRFFGSFFFVALCESAVLQFVLALGLVAAAGGQLDFGAVLAAGFSYLPAIWAMAGLAILLIGFIPKLSALVWAMFAYTFFVMYFGRIMDVPEWVTRITPFGNIPQLPVQDFNAVPLIVLTLIAVAFTALGTWRLKERSIG
ncbi:MAG: hypothetical protein FWD72_06610, partial [Eggerthellaceae bacterium]|nr:hypothetical protein [Eggerthellaceae bacterium]